MFHQLTSASFERIQKDGKDLLILKDFPNNKVLVIFTGNGCEYCVKFIELMKEVAPQFEQDIIIGILNLSNHPVVHEKSKNTPTEITHVPFLILYINHRPYIIYKGDYTYSDIINFLQTSLSEFDKSVRTIDKSRVDATRAASIHSNVSENETVISPNAYKNEHFQQNYSAQQPYLKSQTFTNSKPQDNSDKIVVIQRQSFLTMKEAYS
jgi:thiol-disulfide isomerase/thioredoxin